MNSQGSMSSPSTGSRSLAMVHAALPTMVWSRLASSSTPSAPAEINFIMFGDMAFALPGDCPAAVAVGRVIVVWLLGRWSRSSGPTVPGRPEPALTRT
ncbi:hypothetical protein Acsp05_02470 [Actinokineospora sp. NBRC 105648]|nr:hypothetical protein Acsp05_02470 [Actinokineospora sp. NBRC 105648]